MKKKLATLVITGLFALSSLSTAFAGSWLQDNVGWWYQNDDGTWPASTWFQDVDYKWYYFNESGYMQTEAITLSDGITYTFNSDGSCTNRWAGAANQTYYDYSDGVEKNLGTTLATRDYINSFSGQETKQKTVYYSHVLTPNTKVDFSSGTYYEEYEDEE